MARWVVELADHLGRDYTTVSRREKLEARDSPVATEPSRSTDQRSDA